MQIFNFDLSTKNITQVLNAKQGDVGRKFKAVITDRGAAYVIPVGARFSVWFSGPSGEGNYSAIGERTAFAVDGNTVTVELIAQMLENAGTGVLCLVLSDTAGTQLGLWNMIYAVEHIPGMGSKAAEEYYTAMSELAKQAIEAAATFETDPSLSVGGKAADAAAVGTQLANKAPAGYGLGENSSRSVDNPDTALQSGWYRVQTPYVGWMRVDAYATSHLTQTLYLGAHAGCSMQRHRGGSVWGEWEWVNPPMQLGVEYRTTERWNGKAVWTVAINVGTTAEGAIGTTTDFIASETIRFGGTIGTYANPQIYDSLSHAYTTWANVQSNNGKINITVWARNGTVNLPAVIQVWYTKD